MTEHVTVVAKRRLTQDERSARTKAKILKATIRCLYTRGYSATTTLLVADEAKISRGAMLHQFSTKTELMLFVVRSVFDESVARFKMRETSGNLTEAERAQMAWESVSGPAGIAALEVLMGSRSDRQLASKLKPLHKQIEQEAIEMGLANNPFSTRGETAAMVRLFYWTARGLSIANLLTDTPKDVLDCLELYKKMITTYREAETRRRKAK